MKKRILLIAFTMLISFLHPQFAAPENTPVIKQSSPISGTLNEEMRINIITTRIKDITDRLNNPTTSQSEREMLLKERANLTEILTRYLTNTTRTK
ncbi:MAG TPA: hypothetical protein HPP56_04505 [Nitrospirae bacterium]|nr:hypothetical protein [Nitrospirota bacterium]